MSTYLSGQPTYLPTVQAFQPNLQLFAGALQFKQNQYDTNRKKISDLYGSLLNTQLTRDSNIQARDEFFQTIDYEIKKLANVDLSLEQNVNQAAGLFNSMYDNKNILKDMIWTKNFNNELQRGESFRNCLDPEKCGGQYWEGGIQALEYRRQEFRNADDQSAMMMGDVKYTPYVNVHDMAAKMFKDMDWDVKIDTPNGLYMVTTKNGELIEGSVLAQFQKTLGEDPRVLEYYKTKAYLERKNYGASNAMTYGSQEAAEQNYVTETARIINESLARTRDNIQHKRESNGQIAKDLQENIDNGEILYTQQVQAVADDLLGEVDTYEQTEGQIGNLIGEVDNSIATRSLALQSEAIDNAVAMMLLDQDLASAAHIMAFKNYERTIKENPVALAEQQHQWRMQEIEYEDSLKDKKEEEAPAFAIDEYFTSNVDTLVNLNPQAAYKQLNEDINFTIKQAKTPTSQVVVETFKAAQEKANSGGNGSTQAGQDIVAIVDQAIRSKVNTTKGGKSQAAYDYALKLQQKWNSKSAKEKLGWAKQWDMEKFSENLSYDALRKTHSVVKKFYEQNDYNINNRGYLNELKVNGFAEMSFDADNADQLVTEFRGIKKEISEKVVEQLRTKGGEFGNLYKYLTSGTGDIVSEDAFALKAALGESFNGKFAGKTPTQRMKENENVNYLVTAAKTFWNDRMSPEAKKKYGNNIDKWVDEYISTEANNRGEYNPTVTFKDKTGKTRFIPVEKFFANDGSVRSEYTQYRNNWKPAQPNSTFWENYRKNRKIYRGELKPGEKEKRPTDPSLVDELSLNMVKGQLTLGELALFMYNPSGQNLQNLGGSSKFLDKGIAAQRKNQEFAEYHTPKGKQETSPFVNLWKASHYLVMNDKDVRSKLKGTGSFVTKNLNAFIDYSNPQAKPVMYEQEYLMNAYEALAQGGAVFALGGPSSTIPGKSSADAEMYTKQLIMEAIKLQGKANRPTWTANYSAEPRKGWQAYTITPSDPTFVAKFGKQVMKGVPGQYEGIMTPGANRGSVTIYLKDEFADNALHNGTKLSSMDRMLNYKKQVPLVTGKYDDIHRLKIYKTGSGYEVRGSVVNSIDANGNANYQPIAPQVYPESSSPELIRAEWMNKILPTIKQDLQ